MSKRLQQELMSLMMSGDKGISAFPDGDSLLTWVATVTGPDDCVYEGKLKLKSVHVLGADKLSGCKISKNIYIIISFLILRSEIQASIGVPGRLSLYSSYRSLYNTMFSSKC